MFSRCLVAILPITVVVHAQQSKPQALTEEEQKNYITGKKWNEEGMRLFATGKDSESLGALEKSVQSMVMAFSKAKFPEGHPDLAQVLNNLGVVTMEMGQLSKSEQYNQQALKMRLGIYPKSTHPKGHREIADSYDALGDTSRRLGKFADAVKAHRNALAMRLELFPNAETDASHPILARTLSLLGLALHKSGQSQDGIAHLNRALRMDQRLLPKERFPNGHPHLATRLNQLGLAQHESGDLEGALENYTEALEMRTRLFPKSRFPAGQIEIAISLNNVAGVKDKLGQLESAFAQYKLALEHFIEVFPESKFPKGHPYIALGFNNLGATSIQMGNLSRGIEYLQKALDSQQKLYPNGHPDTARSFRNLAESYVAAGQFDLALQSSEKGLAMMKRLIPVNRFPDGHPLLASAVNSHGSVYYSMQKYQEALPQFKAALAMRRSLYPETKFPKGHREIAESLSNIAVVLSALEKHEDAIPMLEQSIELLRGLYPADRYPNGPPGIGTSLNNLGRAYHLNGQLEQAINTYGKAIDAIRQTDDRSTGSLYALSNLSDALHESGRSKEATDHARECLRLHQQRMRRELAITSEFAAFELLAAQPAYLDKYLGCSLASKEPVASAYEALWYSRGMLSALLRFRRQQARALTGADGDLLLQLRANLRRTEKVLSDPANPGDRDAVLATLIKQRSGLEQQIIAKLPELATWLSTEKSGPADLQTRLPKGVAFIDLIKYHRIKYINGVLNPTPVYVAFVVLTGRPIKRIELGPAEPIDNAVRRWRLDIERRKNGSGGEVSDLVWSKIAPHVSPDTRTLLIQADSDLARVPWSAVPLNDGTVLLETYAVAAVPDALFLFEQLKTPARTGKSAALLAVGNLQYQSEQWPELRATKTELESLISIMPQNVQALSGKLANTQTLSDRMQKADIVHLATHGYFDSATLAEESRRAQDWLKSRQYEDETRRVAAKNPLGFVGLVLSNGEIITGLSIANLELNKLKLVTLSACETGLGEYTGGEGVQGLQRAFHLAGCPNVIASLWKVNDAATAALMAKFYHELWVNKKPPIEALREAQLTIYRRPDLIPDLAGERGAPNLKKAVAVRAGAPATGKGKHADTKLWAAFVLSGVGK